MGISLKTKKQKVRFAVICTVGAAIIVAIIIGGLFIKAPKSYCTKIYEQCLNLLNKNNDYNVDKLISISFDENTHQLEFVGRNDSTVATFSAQLNNIEKYDDALDYLSNYSTPESYTIESYEPYADPLFLEKLTIFDGKVPNIKYVIYKSLTNNYYCSLSILAKDQLFHSSGKLNYDISTHLAENVELLPGFSEKTDDKVRTFIRYTLYL